MSLGAKTATAALGVAIVATAGVGVADASSGSPALLGHHNSASSTTTIKSAHGPALSLKSKKGAAPLKVSSSKLVPKLDAQFLDGKTATQVGPKTKQLFGQFSDGGGYLKCPAGMQPVSGGVLPDTTANTDDDGAYVVIDFPHVNAAENGYDGWEGAASDADGSYGGTGFVWVDCSGSSSSKLTSAVAKQQKWSMTQTLARLRHEHPQWSH
jgi:hypothetical protein